MKMTQLQAAFYCACQLATAAGRTPEGLTKMNNTLADIDSVDAALERFANPFLEHRLADIALHHDKKLETRLRPTLGEFQIAFGRKAKILGEI